MSKKTISKIAVIVILAALVCLGIWACRHASSRDTGNVSNSNSQSAYLEPRIIGTIASSDVNESSGLAASKCQPDVFWTHNDSGSGPVIYAFNSKGVHLGAWTVPGALNKDWEDMAAFKDKNGQCYVYIGEIGNNERSKGEFRIYRVKEPTISPAGASSNKKKPLETEEADWMKWSYADTQQDAETLLVHPETGEIYILTKTLTGAAGVYKLDPDFASGKTSTAKRIADFSTTGIPNGLVTGGSISPDGKYVIICDYFSGYELTLPGSSRDFDEIWKQKPTVVNLGERKQGEAVSYSSDGNSIFATSEKKNSPIIEVLRKS